MQNYLNNNGSDAQLINQYGMSELNSIVTHATKKRKLPYSAGKIATNNRIMILNTETGEKCKQGQKGQIYICSQAVMKGYAKAAKENDSFFSDGREWSLLG